LRSRDRTAAASQLPPQPPANTQPAKREFGHRFYLRRLQGQHGNFSRIMWGWVPAYFFPRQGNPSSSASRIFSPARDRLPENRFLSPESIPRPNGINFASQAVNFGWGSAEFEVSRESVGIRARLPYFKSLWANRNNRRRTDLSVGALKSEARFSDGSSRSPDIKHPDLFYLSENWV
jgi:hypothetical protein